MKVCLSELRNVVLLFLLMAYTLLSHSLEAFGPDNELESEITQTTHLSNIPAKIYLNSKPTPFEAFAIITTPLLASFTFFAQLDWWALRTQAPVAHLDILAPPVMGISVGYLYWTVLQSLYRISGIADANWGKEEAHL